MNTPLNDLLADLNALNEKTYELCCRHRRNADKISDNLNKEIDEAIAFEYTQQLEVHKNELKDAVTTAIYVLDEIHNVTTPVKKRRWYWPWAMKKFGASKEIDRAIATGETSDRLLREVLDTVEDMKNKFLRHMDIPHDVTPSAPPARTCAPQNISGPNEEWENENDTFPDKIIPNPSQR